MPSFQFTCPKQNKSKNQNQTNKKHVAIIFQFSISLTPLTNPSANSEIYIYTKYPESYHFSSSRATILAQAFIISHLDYFNNLFNYFPVYGLVLLLSNLYRDTRVVLLKHYVLQTMLLFSFKSSHLTWSKSQNLYIGLQGPSQACSSVRFPVTVPLF